MVVCVLVVHCRISREMRERMLLLLGKALDEKQFTDHLQLLLLLLLLWRGRQRLHRGVLLELLLKIKRQIIICHDVLLTRCQQCSCLRYCRRCCCARREG